jgi:hypothetical protein
MRPPKSGLPDFGNINVQVGNSRLGWRRPGIQQRAPLWIPGSLAQHKIDEVNFAPGERPGMTVSYGSGFFSSNPCMRNAHCTPTTAPFTGCSNTSDRISVSGR